MATYNCLTEKFEGLNYDDYKLIDVLLGPDYVVCLKLRSIVNKEEYCFVKVINFKNYWYKLNENGDFKTLFGEKCSKTYNYYEKEFEGDINVNYRFMLDHLDKIIKPLQEKDCALLYFDIETLRCLDVKDVPGGIISIAFYSTIYNKDFAFYLKNKKDITNSKDFLDKNIQVQAFETEKQMLLEFLKILKLHDLTFGFNSDFFDTLYFINRCRKLGITEKIGYFKDAYISDRVYEDRFMQMLLEKGSPIKSEINFIDAKPIVTKLFARGNFVAKPSRYSLDEIGKCLNIEKGKISLKDGPATLWEQDRIEELLEYNVQDVSALREIMSKMKVEDMLLTRKNLFKINFNDIFKNSKVIDFLILSMHSDVVFPTITYENTQPTKFEGAVVLNPKCGLYKNVAVLDFNALYPNIILGFNVSPETLIDNSMFKFSFDTIGLLNKVCQFLLDQRYKYKKLAVESLAQNKEQEHDIYKMIEHQFKDCVNSLYGIFGYRHFRLFDVNIASAITYYGRTLLQSVIDYVSASEPQFEILAGDTDSIFIHYKEQTTDVLKVFEELECRINDFLKEYWSNKMLKFNLKMEAETIFNFLILPHAKKSYIGLTSLLKGVKKDNELYAKGFSLIRKDTPSGLKPSLQKFYNAFLINVSKDNMEQVRKDLKELKQQWKTLDYKDFLIVKQMNREPNEYRVVPQHVRSMLYSNQHLGTDFSRSNYKGGCLFVKVHSKYPPTEIITLDEDTPLPTEMTIDIEKYFDLFIKNKIILLNKSFEYLFSKNKSLWDYI